jgi:hypothetical protein
MAMDVSHAIDRHSAFEERTSWWDGDTHVFEVRYAPAAELNLHRVTADFFAMYGECAESSQFVHCAIASDAILFHVVSGRIEGPHAHGHRLCFRPVGSFVAQLVDGVH